MTDKTGDLMNKLTSTESPEELDKYLEEIRDKYPKTLKEYLDTVFSEKRLSKVDVIAGSGIDRTYFYQIMDGSKKPGKDKIIAIVLACKMTLTECQRALEIAGEGILYPKNRRDSLIIYAVNNRMEVRDLNAALEKYGLPQLA